MTVIVAVKEFGPKTPSVTLAADRCIEWNGSIQDLIESKLTRIDPLTVIACAGDLIPSHRLRDMFPESLSQHDDPGHFLRSVWWQEWRREFKGYDTELLIVCRGHIWVLDESGMTEIPEYCAIGSGGSYALGALHSCYGTHPPKMCAQYAVEAAAQFDPYTRGPFDYLTTDRIHSMRSTDADFDPDHIDGVRSPNP